MAKFKVGDKARIVFVRSIAQRYVGATATVGRVENGILDDGSTFEYVIHVDSDGMPGYLMGWQLEPLTPDLGSWDDIEEIAGWLPSELVTVEA